MLQIAGRPAIGRAFLFSTHAKKTFFQRDFGSQYRYEYEAKTQMRRKCAAN